MSETELCKNSYVYLAYYSKWRYQWWPVHILKLSHNGTKGMSSSFLCFGTSLKLLWWKLWLLDHLINSTIHNKIRNLPGTEWKLTVFFLSPDVWWLQVGEMLTLSKNAEIILISFKNAVIRLWHDIQSLRVNFTIQIDSFLSRLLWRADIRYLQRLDFGLQFRLYTYTCRIL